MTATAARPERLVVVSPGVPHPSAGASVVLFFHYVERLRAMGFHLLHILVVDRTNSTRESVAEYTRRVVETGGGAVVACEAGETTIQGRFTPQLDARVQREASRAAEAFDPDAIVCLDLVSAWAVHGVEARAKVVWLGDLTFLTEWYHGLYSMRERPWRSLLLALVWIRCRAWKRRYRRVLADADSVIVSSMSSEAHLKTLAVEGKYLPYPWPGSAVAAEPGRPSAAQRPRFLFFGNLTALGSRSALHFMVGAVYPRLLKLWGRHGFEIVICGAGDLPGWLRRELPDKPELRFLGFVDDLVALMRSVHAVLSPIDVPVGNRSRIITALASGALVIAHANTAGANPALLDGVTCYLAADADSFVDRMRKSVEQPREAEQIIAGGLASYRSQFEPDAATAMFAEEVERVLRRAAGRVSQKERIDRVATA